MATRSPNPIETLRDLIRHLPPELIGDAEIVVRDARRRSEAGAEIDKACRNGDARVCPHCRGTQHQRWGLSVAGAQRWRCSGCDRTWSGRTGTRIAHLHRPDLLLDAVRDMMSDAPRSCRKLAASLGLSHHTVWRWRMLILDALGKSLPVVLRGLIETDPTSHRESRKGSREWVRHLRNASAPKPPRPRWKDFGIMGPPKGFVLRWQQPVLATTDRSGTIHLAHMPNQKQSSIATALLPLVASDAVLLFDGAPQFEAIARSEGMGYQVLIAGRRTKAMPKSCHLNTVNGLHSRWKAFLLPFCGPASKNLDAYARWYLARRSGYLPAFQALLA